MSKQKDHEALRVPLDVTCELDRNVHRVLMTLEDASALYRIFKGDESLLWVLTSWDIEQVLTTEVEFQQFVQTLLNKYKQEVFVPYVIKRKRLWWWTVIGFDLYTVHDGCQDREVEMMFALGKKYRGRGYHQVATHSGMKELAERGFTSTRWIDEHNAQSWRANHEIGTLNRTAYWAGHAYGVFVVSPQDWPEVSEQLREKYHRRRRQKFWQRRQTTS